MVILMIPAVRNSIVVRIRIQKSGECSALAFLKSWLFTLPKITEERRSQLQTGAHAVQQTQRRHTVLFERWSQGYHM